MWGYPVTIFVGGGGGVEGLRSQRRALTTADTAGALSDAAATCILRGSQDNITPLTGRHRPSAPGKQHRTALEPSGYCRLPM